MYIYIYICVFEYIYIYNLYKCFRSSAAKLGRFLRLAGLPEVPVLKRPRSSGDRCPQTYGCPNAFVQNCRSRGNLTFKGAQNRRSRANLTFKGAPNRRSRANLTFKSCPKPPVQSQLERQCNKTIKVTRQDKTSANATERRCS